MKENNSLTIKGIRLVTVVLSLVVVMAVISIVLSELSPPELRLKSSINIAGIFVLILGLIGIYGIYLIIKGRKEFNPNHEKNVIIVKKLIIFWIIFFVIKESFLPNISSFAIIQLIINVIIGIPLWLAVIYLIKELAEQNIKKLLWINFFVYIIINSVEGYVDVVAKNETSLYNLYLLATLIAIIPALILVFCYYKTYIKLKESSTLA